MKPDQIKNILPYAFFSFAIAIILGLILYLDHGTFSYSLDDPYIHLKLADNIFHGTYGLNPGEPASPSSSILWPFLLVPFIAIGIGQFPPLVINILAAFAVIRTAALILDESIETGLKARAGLKAFLLIVFILAINLVGLVITGMEHTLQVFLALLVLLGLLREHRTGRLSWWFHVAVVLGPFVRYESLVLSVPVLVYLLYRKRIKPALFDGACLAVILAGFSWWLLSQGLPWLPSSVVIKSPLVRDPAYLRGVAINVYMNILELDCIPFLLGLFLMFLRWLRSKDGFERILSFGIAVGAVAYLVGGRFGGLSRYQLFIWAVLFLWLTYIYRHRLSGLLEGRSATRSSLLLGLVVLLLSGKYVANTILSPLASNNIFDQQFQMHRFIVDNLQAPVAVNDIGWVAYQNDDYVLDLYGLASPVAWENRRNRTADVEWMNTLCLENNVTMVMIYTGWFKGIPKNWTELGYLRLDRLLISPAADRVVFFAVDPRDVEYLKGLLSDFSEGLPPGATFVFAQ